MIMRVKLDCGCCVAKVFRAVGAFLSQDEGPATIKAVEVFRITGERNGAVVAWDVHPTQEQIDEFRQVWDCETGMDDATILHDAPSSIVDLPRFSSREA